MQFVFLLGFVDACHKSRRLLCFLLCGRGSQKYFQRDIEHCGDLAALEMMSWHKTCNLMTVFFA